MFTVSPPVGGDHAVIAPFLAENADQHVAVFGSAVSVDEIVAGHHAPRMSLLHNDLELLQIDLTDGTLGSAGIGILAVGFLVVEGKMLYGCRNMCALNSFYHPGSLLSGKERVLGIVLKVAPAQGTAMDVHGRSQPHADVVLHDLFTARTADGVGGFRIPGAGKKRRARESGCLDADLRENTKPCRAVRSHDIRNSVFRKISVAEGIGNAGVRLSADQLCKRFIGQCMDEILQRHASLCHIDQLRQAVCFSGPGGIGVRLITYLGHAAVHLLIGKPFQYTVAGIVGLSKRQVLIASVCAKTHGELCGSHAAYKAAHNAVCLEDVMEFQLRCGADVGSEEERIASLFQNPGGFADASEVIIACKILGRRLDGNELALARLKKTGLLISAQYLCGLSEESLRCSEIELNDLTAGIASGVRDENLGVNRISAVRIRALRCLRIRIGFSFYYVSRLVRQ